MKTHRTESLSSGASSYSVTKAIMQVAPIGNRPYRRLAIGNGRALATRCIAAAAVFIASTFTSTGQAEVQSPQQPPDSVVAIVADAEGLPSVPPDQRPLCAAFWEVRSSLPCLTRPLPWPPWDPSTPVYALGAGQYLVDQTGGQLLSPQAQYGRGTLSTADPATILQAQVEELQRLIAEVQQSQLTAQLSSRSLDSVAPPPPGEGGDTNGSGGIALNAYHYTTNDLWLEIM